MEFILKKSIFVADNAAIHKTTKDVKYFEENKLLMIKISPYSPLMNPVENLILEIKEKICRQHKVGKLVSLQMINKIVFGMNQKDLQNNFNKSQYETAMFVHSMKISLLSFCNWKHSKIIRIYSKCVEYMKQFNLISNIHKLHMYFIIF